MSSAEITEWGAYFGLLEFEETSGMSIESLRPEDVETLGQGG